MKVIKSETMITLDCGIIGGGVAGVFAALRISENYPNLKTIIFDISAPAAKRRRFLEGWLGCLPNSNGRFYISDINKLNEIIDGRKAHHISKWTIEQLKNICSLKEIKNPSPTSSMQKKIKQEGFELEQSNYYQWYPEQIHLLSKNIVERIQENKNLIFSFENEVYKVLKKKNYFLVSTSQGDFACKKILLCAGRSGWRWVNSLYNEFGLAITDRGSFGIRAEIGSQYLKDFNQSHCTISGENLEVGPFNWFGTVIPEDHADLVLSGFRSNEARWKTDKVSFSILNNNIFTNDGVNQMDRIAKLSFIIANDRVAKDKIKNIFNKTSQICLLPEFSWLEESLNKLEKLIPELNTKGSYFIPEVKPLCGKINIKNNLETEVEDFFVAGESSGYSGLLFAALSGAAAADFIAR